VVFLASDGIDLSPYVDAFVKGMLKGFVLVWPLWVVLGLIVAGSLILGTYRRVKRSQSRSDWP